MSLKPALKTQQISKAIAIATVLLSSTLVNLKPSWSAPDDADQVRFLAAAIQNARQKSWRAQAKITTVTDVSAEANKFFAFFYRDAPAGTFPTSDTKQTDVAWWNCDGAKLAVMVEQDDSHQSNDPVTTIFEKIVSNANKVKALVLTSNAPEVLGKPPFLFFQGRVAHTDEILTDGIWKDHKELDPRFLAYGNEGSFIDQIFLDPKNKVYYLGEETVEGSKCAKVEIQFPPQPSQPFQTYWIDLEHGYVLRRLVYSNGPSREQVAAEKAKALQSAALTSEQRREIESLSMDKLRFVSHQVTVPRLLESNGVWLPAIMESSNSIFLGSIAQKPDGSYDASKLPVVPAKLIVENGAILTPPVLQHIAITSFLAGTDYNPEPGTFDLHWPLETQVDDDMENKQFYVTGLSPSEFKVVAAQNATPAQDKVVSAPQLEAPAPSQKK